MAHRAVSVVVDRQDHRRSHSVVISVPCLVSYRKVVAPEPLRLHKVHATSASFAALGCDRHRVSDHPSRRTAARLVGGKYLADRSVHDHVYFTFGSSAQPSGLCLRSLVAPLRHVANSVSALEESPERVAFLEQRSNHCVLPRGVRVNRSQLHSELRQVKARLLGLSHRPCPNLANHASDAYVYRRGVLCLVREATPPPGHVRCPALPVRSPVRGFEALVRDMGERAEDLECSRYFPPQRAVVCARVPSALPPKCFPRSSLVEFAFSAASITEGRVQRQVADKRGEGAVQVALGELARGVLPEAFYPLFVAVLDLAARRFVDAAAFVSVLTPSSERTSRSITSTL